MPALPPDVPIHIHVAEQLREVDDCIAWSRRSGRSTGCSTRFPGRRALVPRARHASRPTARPPRSPQTGATVGPLPDHRGQPRRRPLSAGALPRRRRPHRHRQRQQRLPQSRGGTALARIRPASRGPPPRGRGDRSPANRSAAGSGARRSRAARRRSTGGPACSPPGTRADLVVLDAAHPALGRPRRRRPARRAGLRHRRRRRCAT